jgi:hypothetical protein
LFQLTFFLFFNPQDCHSNQLITYTANGPIPSVVTQHRCTVLGCPRGSAGADVSHYQMISRGHPTAPKGGLSAGSPVHCSATQSLTHHTQTGVRSPAS